MPRKSLIVKRIIRTGKLEFNVDNVVFTDSIQSIQIDKNGCFLIRTSSEELLVSSVLMYNGRPSQYLMSEGREVDKFNRLHECSWVNPSDYYNLILDFIRHDEE